MRTLCLTALLSTMAIAAPALGDAQTQIDRIVVRVNRHIITSSDIRQARLLKLVSGGTDEEIQRALENRLLMLDEVTRLAPGDPPAEAVAEHRRDWAASLGSGNQAELLTRVGMSEAALAAWMADDIRIRDYLGQRFGAVPEADRQQNIDDWLLRLRQRAGLR